MVREIVFDTETTGLSVEKGDRLVDIGAVELINHLPTGKVYHQYINPERSIPEEVVAVHGLTEDFLKDFPTFSEIAQDFVDFVGEDGILVAHNASFDMGFINYQLKKCGFEPYPDDRVIDTLESNRTLHGALIDADLLAKVYLELLGGDEPSMLLGNSQKDDSFVAGNFADVKKNRVFHEPRVFALSEEDEKKHREFLEGKIKNSIWLSDELNSSDN